MPLRVAACQILTYPEPAKSTEKVIAWMEEAVREEVSVIAFPEAALCGYAGDPDYWKQADPEEFRACERQVIDVASALDLGVILGTIHWEDEVLYNSLLIIDRGGKVRGRYAKTHLAERWPAPGTHLPLYEVAGVPSCFIICHDVRYPELVRLPVIAGARICSFCSNESGLLLERKLSAYHAMPVARATENSIYLVMAHSPADPENLGSPSQSHGNSKIVHPDGNALAEAGYFEETLVIADLDLDAATGEVAQRAVDDETVLQQWMKAGAELVHRSDTGD